jgi:hypothetical protein
MKTNKLPPEVPIQQEGAYSDTVSSQVFNSHVEALHFYEIVKQRLVNINNWHSYAGAMTADFKLCNASGEPVERPVEKGDHFRIDIPGPGSKSGDGYDWVKVVAIRETNTASRDEILIKVQPVTSPCNDEPAVAHFFTGTASSTFMVTREGDKVTAEVHGRNEMPNANSEHLADKVRNVVIGAVGMGFFSKFQWKKLVDGLVRIEKG